MRNRPRRLGANDAFLVRFFAMGALSAQWVVVSAPAAKNRMRNRQRGPKRRVPHAPTAIGGIADGVHWSTADTLERG